MEWTDDGIVLGIKRHGEANAILELMTREHGRHLGLVRGGAGSRMRPVLQPGNLVHVNWRARLDEHLGTYTVEGLNLRAASFLTVAHALHAVSHVSTLARLLPERDPHESVFDTLDAMLDHLDDPALAAALVVRYEVQLLSELGFELDLLSCAATGATSELVYVSPKSGRAVSRTGGEAWQDKLLRLPDFIATEELEERPSAQALADGFALTGFFLARNVFEPHGQPLPDARSHLVASIVRALKDAA